MTQNQTQVAGGPQTSLVSMFQPRSIAIIGASERNTYACLAVQNLKAVGYSGMLHMVNPRGGTIFGQEAVASCAAIVEPIDAAFLCVPVAGVCDAMREAAQAGIRNVVILAGGFAEIGGEGAAREAALLAHCDTYGLRMLGPNCLGYVNYADKVAIGSIPVEADQSGSLAIVSGSGATAFQLGAFAQQIGVGCSHLIATGNEANVTTADCIDSWAIRLRLRSRCSSNPYAIPTPSRLLLNGQSPPESPSSC